MWKLKIAEGSGPWLTTTNGHVGRQHWEFDPEAGSPEERAQVEKMRQEFKQNRFRRKQSSDLFMRMQLRKENSCGHRILPPVKVGETEDITEEAAIITLRRAISFYSTLQAHDGHWPTEYSGPLYFPPPLVIALYITGDLNAILSPEHQKEIIRYVYNHQNEDGGWGLHIEGHSIVFSSILNYITLRLLGEGPEDGEEKAMARARKWILDHGGAVAISSWGKFFLSLLGVYEWEGCNPIPPEIWLLPKSFPIHPGRLMSYFRLIYMPMSYLYGKKFVGTISGLVKSLRQELYVMPYQEIDWNKARNTCATEDLFHPFPWDQDMMWGFLYYLAEPILTRWPFSILREKALRKAMEHVHYEDESSRYVCVAVIEKVIRLIACWVEDPNSEAYKRHLARFPDVFWVAEDGLKLQLLGSQTWDVALSIQAILSSDLAEEYGPTLKKAHDYLKAAQLQDDPPGNFHEMYRHISKGGWTLATQDHGWQVSDCTAEALKVVLAFARMPPELVGERIETERLYDAVNIILSLQRKSGGFSAWEPEQSYRWLEKFNPIEFLEGAVIELEYTECTGSVIEGLVRFRKWHPGHRQMEIESSIKRAVRYIENKQELDGSWYGNWGICYTYGTFFAVKALVASGKNYLNSASLRKACRFLLSKQLADGGWGESYLTYAKKVYTNLEGNRSNLVQTSWALLSLILAGQAEVDPKPIHRGVRLLINSQMDDGDFPQQEITGVTMKHSLLHYSAYRNIFPIWAIGEYRRRVLRA